MSSRVVVFGYAVLAYLVFLATSAWAVFFLVKGVDSGRTGGAALAIDGALLLAFAAQHSIMARDGFKAWITRLIPKSAERSTYVLLAGLFQCALFGFWRPVPTVIWDVTPLVWIVYAAGWLLVVWSTYMVDHADFLGLKQAYAHLRGLPYAEPKFTERYLYARCRHPMMLGLLIAFWATPHLTVGHLFLAVSSTAYILVGIRFEERALRARLGADYEEYAQRVPALVPIGRPRSRVS